jgi:hypothetical protein
MGKVVQFPIKPPARDSLDLPLPESTVLDSAVSEQCIALFRMLTKDIKAGKRKPECFFLLYGSHWDHKPSTMSWSYLALNFAPAELAAAVKRVVKDLKKSPVPLPEIPDDCA